MQAWRAARGRLSRVSDAILTATLAGLAAGLGVAMPLGAIGVLILRESMLNGLRSGAAAAAGVAFVDLVYCALAVSAGALLAPLISAAGVVAGVVSGLVVIGLGVHQLLTAPAPTNAALDVPRRAVFARFVGLTAINPLTLLYFLALAGGLTATGGGAMVAPAFVIAAGVASLAWQLGLAAVGKVLGATIPERVTRLLGLVASGLIIALGVAVIVGTLLSR